MAKGQSQAPATLDGAIVESDSFHKLLRKMSLRANLDRESGSGISDTQISAILDASTEEEMWDADERGPLNGKKLAGIEMLITEIAVKYSTGETGDEDEIVTKFVDETGRKLYLIITATRISDAPPVDKTILVPGIGETFEWNTSAPFLVAKLFWLEEHGRLPAECWIKSIPLGGPGGRTVLKLKPVSRRTVPA